MLGTIKGINRQGRFGEIESAGQFDAIFKESDLAPGQSFWDLAVGDKVEFDSEYIPGVHNLPKVSSVTKL